MARPQPRIDHDNRELARNREEIAPLVEHEGKLVNTEATYELIK